MLHAGIAGLAVLLLLVVLYAEQKEHRSLLVPSKGILSSLFILAALLEPHPLPGYFGPLLWGLALCLCGDVCLALPQRRMFLLGLVCFLAGHGFYVAAFLHAGKVGAWTLWGALISTGFSGWIYFWLSPHLGKMRGPVVVYILLITAMVTSAASVLPRGDLGWQGRIMVFCGALCFYFSDIFVARDRFMGKAFVNRLIGLPMYYVGQFLLAFSTGLVK